MLAGKAGGQLFCLKSSVPLVTSLRGVCPCHRRGLQHLPPCRALLPRVILQGLCPAVRLVLAQPTAGSVVVLPPVSYFQQFSSYLSRQFCWRNCAAGRVHRTGKNSAGFMKTQVLEECHLFMFCFALDFCGALHFL